MWSNLSRFPHIRNFIITIMLTLQHRAITVRFYSSTHLHLHMSTPPYLHSPTPHPPLSHSSIPRLPYSSTPSTSLFSCTPLHLHFPTLALLYTSTLILFHSCTPQCSVSYKPHSRHSSSSLGAAAASNLIIARRVSQTRLVPSGKLLPDLDATRPSDRARDGDCSLDSLEMLIESLHQHKTLQSAHTPCSSTGCRVI